MTQLTPAVLHDPPGNDFVDSLKWKLPDGVVVILYDEQNGKGRQFIIWGSGQIDSLERWGFDKKTSRWSWFYVGGIGSVHNEIFDVFAVHPPSARARQTLPLDSMRLFKYRSFVTPEEKVDDVTKRQQGKLQTLAGGVYGLMTSLQWKLPPGVVVVFYKQEEKRGDLVRQFVIWGEGQLKTVKDWGFHDAATHWAWYYLGLPRETPTDLVSAAMAGIGDDEMHREVKVRRDFHEGKSFAGKLWRQTVVSGIVLTVTRVKGRFTPIGFVVNLITDVATGVIVDYAFDSLSLQCDDNACGAKWSVDCDSQGEIESNCPGCGKLAKCHVEIRG